METDTKILSSLNYANKEFTVGGRFAKMTVFDNGNDLTLEFVCNENGDFNNSIVEVVDKGHIDEFATCIKAFDGKNMLSILDSKKAVEIQFGYDVAKDIEVFFDLVDYEYDPIKEGSKPHIYSVMVERSKREYAALRELLTFLKSHRIDAEMKGVSDEHKLNPSKH